MSSDYCNEFSREKEERKRERSARNNDELRITANVITRISVFSATKYYVIFILSTLMLPLRRAAGFHQKFFPRCFRLLKE